MNECASGYGTRRWWKLTPDAFGSYVNGLWTRAADSNNARKYFASAVLADGRLLVIGGEYSDVSGSNANDDTAAGEIYDPVVDAWTSLAPPPGVTQIGDSACCLLPDGHFLLGNFNSASTFLFDPQSGTWTGAVSKGDSASEETWVLMPEGTVLVPQCTNAPQSEMYDIATNTWMPAGTLAANIVETASLEIGPGILLPDGRAFFVGAAGGVTAIYQPGGIWAAGPAIPPDNANTNRGSKDGPGALLPSGTVLFPVAPVDGSQSNYLAPSTFFEFDGRYLTQTSDPANYNCATYLGRLLLIPTGQVIWVREDKKSFYAYTETGQPQPSFRPVITSFPATINQGSTVSVSGRQFNGLSQAVGYGDDYAAATNYPLVRIRHNSTGNIRYCRTANHTRVNSLGVTVPSMGVATGAAIITTHATIPANIDLGPSQLEVVANGIASAPVNVTVVP